MQWETVIGLEVHVQLATRSKLFSGAATAYGAEPNIQACAVDLGLPGVLPVLNEQVLYFATQFGLAINACVAEKSVFARKNYFYPDLPKGYQITQYELPIVSDGYLDIQVDDADAKRRIHIVRAHLEEDAGKSLHDDFHGMSGIDLNRAGTPLLEIVTAPDLRNAQQASTYLKKLHTLVRYLGISDGNMQEGSFRCDANVSVRPLGTTDLGTRTETKNLNSFRFVERAIEYEAERHIEIIENGGEVVQETRLYDADRDETRAMRSKEEAEDYRYFPDPDLLPVVLEKQYIDTVRDSLPELPDAKQQRFCDAYGLSDADAGFLTGNVDLADYYEAVVNAGVTPKLAANWVMGALLGGLNRDNLEITASPVSAEQLAALLRSIEDATISGKIAKEVFDAQWQGEGTAEEIIQRRGLQQISDTAELERIVAEVVDTYPEQVSQYRAGKQKVFGFFVGKVMQATQGKANPQQVNELLKTRLQD